MTHRVMWLVVVLGLLCGPLTAGESAQVSVVRFESVTVAATAVGLSTETTDPSGFGQMSACRGRLETGQIRQRWDGTDPTATEGELVEIGDIVRIDDHRSAVLVRWIRTGGTTGVLKITCWR